MKKLFKHFLFWTLSVVLLTGCNDYLDVKNKSELTIDNYYTSFDECRAGTAALYNKVWYDFSSQFYFLFGDGRGNNLFTPYGAGTPLINLTETIEEPVINSAWQSMYIVANQATYAVRNLNQAIDHGVPLEQVNQCKGEARFMRGLAYWYLGSIWKNVPIVEDPAALIINPVVNSNKFEDVLQYAIKDMEYAAEWLPETDDDGRVTKYSAKGMLARFYITAACYARGGNFERWTTTAAEYYKMAEDAAKEVIDEGGYSLMADYEELFRIQNNNNTESLFALQFVPGQSEYGVGNRNQEWLCFNTDIVGGLTSYISSTFASGELVELMHNRGETKRKKATFFYPGAVYDYMGGHTTQGNYAIYHESDGAAPTTPGNAKLRYPNIKKHVVGGPADTDGQAINGNSGLAAPMLRLAEVYLLYAEAILGMKSPADTTKNPQALLYFNEVRTRAGLSPVTAISIDSVWNERRCELALEGQFWYDMVRRSYWDQAWVLDYMANQHRNEYYYYLHPTQAPTGFVWRDIFPGQDTNPPSEERLTLPYPSNELTANPLLKEEPIPFDFKE